ncbi:hypothetical protein L3X38_031609 [Prunus dulcis]|uniref:Uncharacterized protein n=1 Tax=Prunus dulcis TaxID=3755 RepID=A0AAD4YU71_PRUDU|nr:hypothetical protein L3X38_031609 [Prunus dulcis]
MGYFSLFVLTHIFGPKKWASVPGLPSNPGTSISRPINGPHVNLLPSIPQPTQASLGILRGLGPLKLVAWRVASWRGIDEEDERVYGRFVVNEDEEDREKELGEADTNEYDTNDLRSVHDSEDEENTAVRGKTKRRAPRFKQYYRDHDLRFPKFSLGLEFPTMTKYKEVVKYYANSCARLLKFVKNKPGQLVNDVGIDVNKGMFPIAFGVVEIENIECWTWFLEIFFRDVVRATTVPWWEAEMEKIRDLFGEAYKWLEDRPASHWSISHFKTGGMCDMLLNNLCQKKSRVRGTYEIPKGATKLRRYDIVIHCRICGQ